jgi:hypothetical protein
MNYDLAMMALEGLTRAPLTVRVEGSRVTISGDAPSFKELARLCLLLGGAGGGEDSFELQPSMHVAKGSPGLKLELS